MYWCTSSHMYTYLLCVLTGTGDTKEESVRRGKFGEGYVGNFIITIRMISIYFLMFFFFMIAKGLYDVNMKCLFCGEFC